MEDFFASIVAILIAFYLFLVGPVYNNFSEADNYVNNQVSTITNQYQNEIRNNGYIDLETYNKFLNELAKTKRIYEVEIIHKSALVYPKGTNDYQTVFIDYGNKQIISTIYSGQKYYLKSGDEVKITVTQTQKDLSKVLMNSLKGYTGDVPYIKISSGGMVKNEAN